jgi:hypothetical protein
MTFFDLGIDAPPLRIELMMMHNIAAVPDAITTRSQVKG